MRLKFATGYGTVAIVVLPPLPKGEGQGLSLPEESTKALGQQTAETVASYPEATSPVSSLLALNRDIRREALYEQWGLVVLWTAAWTALAVLCV
jgi:hypothetical protein